MTLSSLNVIWIAAVRRAIYLFPLVACSNNDFNWHRLRDITTFTEWAYAIACYPAKSIIFEKIVEITGHIRLIHVSTCRTKCNHISWGIGVRKVSNSKSDLQGRQGHWELFDK